MSKSEFPSRLEKDPIVDCLIQLRFKLESESAADVLPGVMYSYLKDEFPRMEKTPIAQIPPSVRMVDPNLKYSSTVEFVGSWGRVGIADCALQIKTSYPYPGWEELRPRAEKILGFVMEAGLVSSYERLSILYQNIITTGRDSFDLSPLELNLEVGRDIGKRGSSTLLRTEFPHDSGTTIVQVQTGAEARIERPDHPVVVLRGPHLSVDTIGMGNIHNPEQMKARLDLVHRIEREVFFKMLKPETWEQLKPVWDS